MPRKKLNITAPAKKTAKKAEVAPASEDQFSDEDYADSADEGDVVWDMEDDSKEDNNVPEKRQAQLEESHPNKKFKLSKRELHRPPTADELNSLKEVETLFHSNLFGLQLTDLLKEIKLKEKHALELNTWLEFFKKALQSLPPWKSTTEKPEKVLKKVKVPLKASTPAGSRCRFRFMPPASVKPVGSFLLNAVRGPDYVVDVALEMPAECFEKTDFLNQRYHRKRALYLAIIAAHLEKSEFVEEMTFQFHHGTTTMPVLCLKPAGKAGKHFKVCLLPYPCSDVFKVSRFIPRRSNVRASWFFSSNRDGLTEELPSPRYNASVLSDLRMIALNDYFTEKLGSLQAVQDVIVLLKLWLHKRELDQEYGAFSGFLITAYVTYLLKNRKISTMMSSYQAMRYVLISLSQSDWTKEPISLCSESQQNQPTIEEFSENYPLVFIDPSGFLNLSAHTSVEAYLRVKYEAHLAITFLDSCSADSFQAMFMTPVPFHRTFDLFVRLDESDIKSALDNLSLRSQLADTDGNKSHVASHAVCSILRRGLNRRISLLSARLTASPEWGLTVTPPEPKNSVDLGIILNTPECYNLVDKGPPANAPEALEFRKFWGDRSDLRRFQDGSILEAVVWHAKMACEQRELVLSIVRNLLQQYIHVEGVTCVGDFLDPLLRLSNVTWRERAPYGTGEETNLIVTKTYDEFSKQLRRLNDLPLEVSSIQGISAVLRSMEVFPPFKGFLSTDFGTSYTVEDKYLLPVATSAHFYHLVMPVEVIVHMEASGKWPDDFQALQRVKAAFHLALAKELKQQCSLPSLVRPGYIDVLKEGFVFRVRIACHKEITLAKVQVSPDGMVRMKETETSLHLEYITERLPGLTSALHGLQQQHGTFGAAGRLAKRWVSAQLLYGHVPDECVELLVASLYLMPAPYAVPNSPRVAFQRFLALLVNHDWNTQPLIIDFASKLTKEKCAEVQSTFINCRSTLPAMFIATPFDGDQLSPWTRHAPTGQILCRLVALAKASLQLLEQQISYPVDIDVKQIFRAPLEPYDVLIHLDEARIPNAYQAVDCNVRMSIKSGLKLLFPVVGMDVVTRYVQTLRDAYSDFALFFYDHYGGHYVAVLWKPKAFEPQPFKVSAVAGRMLSGEGKLIPNVEAILDDFSVLGQGLVKFVEARTSKWKI